MSFSRRVLSRTSFRFLEEMKSLLRRTKILNGDVFFPDPRNKVFDSSEPKKEKIPMCVGRADLALWVAKTKSSRRVLRTTCIEVCRYTFLLLTNDYYAATLWPLGL